MAVVLPCLRSLPELHGYDGREGMCVQMTATGTMSVLIYKDSSVLLQD